LSNPKSLVRKIDPILETDEFLKKKHWLDLELTGLPLYREKL
jgi:hypothetical protein